MNDRSLPAPRRPLARSPATRLTTLRHAIPGLWGAGALLALAALYFALSAVPGVISTNDGSHYALTKALATEGTARIDPYVNYAAIQPARGTPTSDDYRDVSYYQGHWYSDRPPGTAILAVPAYWVGQLAGALSGRDDIDFPLRYATMLPPLLGALTALALYALARGLGAGPGAASWTAATGALTTLLVKYATLLYSHVGGALCVTAALTLLLSAEPSGERGVGWRRGRLALGGAALGYGAVVEYPNLLLIVPCGLYLLWRLRAAPRVAQRDAVAAFGLGWLLPVLLLLGYNWAVFGRPWHTSYTYQYYFTWSRQLSTTYVTPLGTGLRWLLVGPSGLLLVTPAFLLALWGLFLLARRAPARAALLAGVVLTVLIPTALHRTYYGGGSRDTRYLLAIVPALYAPLALWLDWLNQLRLPARLLGWGTVVLLAGWGLLRSYLSLVTMFGHPAVERPPAEALALLRDHWREPAFVAPSLWLTPYFLVLAVPLTGLGWFAWARWTAGRGAQGAGRTTGEGGAVAAQSSGSPGA